MLSSTAFDGFRETTPFYRLYWQNLDDVFRPILGANSYETYQTLALFLSPFVFLSVYLLLIWLAKAVTNTKLSLRELSLQFAFSLIPIAFVYNVAHYYTLVVTEGSNMGRLISDPFGKNWNLFGTANWPNIPTVDTNFVWHSQVAFILLGHIVGVYIAHIIALKVFPSHKKALISQFPLLILMVIYTMAGLWILSQPITSGLE
ncbi:MAG: FedB [uncultured bacterium]|nr:MAG: FedB [uncultured bacterium]